MSFRGARATRNPNHGSLLKISPFGRNDKNGGYSKFSNNNMTRNSLRFIIFIVAEALIFQ